MIDSIVVENANDNISDLVSFAKMLGERAYYNARHLTVENYSSSGDSRESGVAKRRPSSTTRTSEDLTEEAAAVKAEPWTHEDSSRLIAFKENSSEFALQKLVQSMMHDPNTPESSTRQNFIDTFAACDKGIDEIRMCIDGLHEVSGSY